MTKPTGRPRGRPRKIPALAVLHGDRPRPPAQAVPATLTDAPEDLTPAERDRWEIYAEPLLDLGRLTVLSWPALADLCRNEVLVAEMRAQLRSEGLTGIGQKGETIRNPLLLSIPQ